MKFKMKSGDTVVLSLGPSVICQRSMLFGVVAMEADCDRLAAVILITESTYFLETEKLYPTQTDQFVQQDRNHCDDT